MRTLVLGIVLLAASSVAAQAEDRRECIERFDGWLDGDKPMTMTVKKRICDPQNFVSDPNEYGWVCYDARTPMRFKRVKGEGAKQQRDALCIVE